MELIVGLKIICFVGALVLAGYTLFTTRGSGAVTWAVFLLALGLLLAR